MHRSLNCRPQVRESGQTLILFTLFIIVLILFVGLGIDLGFAYITRAQLSKAVDAACLTGIRNYNSDPVKEQSAKNLAASTFRANYGTSGRDVAPVILDPSSITFSTVHNNIALDIKATTHINTFFIRVLPALLPAGPSWKTLTVGSAAQATRPNLIMTLVLDTSGSMDPKRGPVSDGGDGTGSGGGKYLPTAVTTFINNFDDQQDKAAMVKFEWIQTDVVFAGALQRQPKQPFKQDIINAVNAFDWNGATFSQGGLTNGLVMENNANAAISPGENVVKVIVFFTDGLANTIQDTLNCGGVPTLRNFGGYDANDNVGCIDPLTYVPRAPELGGTGGGGALACCPGVTQFNSSFAGSMKDFHRLDVTAEGEWRCIKVANEMRANKTIVYSIGVGAGINQTFLAKVANDPSAGGTPTSYDGISIVANNPADLPAVFQKIAETILARLTR